MHSKKNTPPKPDSNGSSAALGNNDEYITVHLPDIHKEVQCPICLGIIRKTRTVMECVHRFCGKCIDKSMRLWKNECPVCRTHCASRRSMRDDPKYDALITILYPNMDKYEEEELPFHEEERAQSKQIQGSITQPVQQQSEALGKKPSSARTTAAAYARRSQVYQDSRRKRNQRANEQQGSRVVHTNDHDRGKYSSSADEMVKEVKPKRSKILKGSRFSQMSLAEGSADGGDENVREVNRDSLGASAGLVGNREMLVWGKCGIRSTSRQRKAQNDVLEIHLTLVPLDDQRIPSLQCLRICCSPTVSIRYMCQYVGLKTGVGAELVEMLVKGLQSESDPTVISTVSISGGTIDPCKDKLHILVEHETLSELQAMYSVNGRDLVFAYRIKKVSSASTNSI